MITTTKRWLENNGIEFLLIALVASTVVLVTAALFSFVCRRRSAAFQNLVWRCAILLAILLPVAIVCLPKFGMGLSLPETVANQIVQQDQSMSVSRHSITETLDEELSAGEIVPLISRNEPISNVDSLESAEHLTANQMTTVSVFPGWQDAVVMLWGLFAISKLFKTLLAVVVTHRWRLRSVEYSGQEISDTRVRFSGDVEVPMTIGITQPLILLPHTATQWSRQTVDMVLDHERAHVARHDVIWNFIASLIKAVLWWQPMCWYAHRQLLVFSEKACDDMVLNAGAGPVDYAKELLSLARQYRFSKQQILLPAASIAQPPIEQRIASILKPSLDRGPVTQSVRFVIWSVMLVAVLTVGSLRPFSKNSLAWSHQDAVAKQSESPGGEEQLDPEQELLQVEVLVTDANGQPVANAAIKPWAVQSSIGHGQWGKERTGGFEPLEVLSDENGKAVVKYAKYVNLEERVKAAAITLSINSPDHPYVSYEDIVVPCDSTHAAKLPAGAAVNVELICKEADINNGSLYLSASSGRPSVLTEPLKVDKDNRLRIPPFVEGIAELMFALVEDGKVTHFSRIVALPIDASKGDVETRIELIPALKIEGRFDENVPRPIKNGRVQASTMVTGRLNETVWNEWSRVKEDGTFSILWPQQTPIQFVALCDGFIAKNGVGLEEMRGKSTDLKTQFLRIFNAGQKLVSPGRKVSGYLRPQLFLDPASEPVTIAMTPLVKTFIEVEDAFGKKLEGIQASTNPNVNWSQSSMTSFSNIYCSRLSSTIDYLHNGKHSAQSRAKTFEKPFAGISNSQGQIEIDLPVGSCHLYFGSERFQLAAKLGRRSRKIHVVAGKEQYMRFNLQPKGLDSLGDWEDLYGLVFG